MAKFAKGKSGNPNGRKPGSSNKVTRALRDAMLAVYEQMGGERALLTWARKSRTEFFKLMLTKMVPAGAPVHLDQLTGSPADQARQVVAAMGDGRITPDEAATVMQVLAAQAKVIEADELARRIAALEERLGNGNAGSAPAAA